MFDPIIYRCEKIACRFVEGRLRSFGYGFVGAYQFSSDLSGTTPATHGSTSSNDSAITRAIPCRSTINRVSMRRVAVQ